MLSGLRHSASALDYRIPNIACVRGAKARCTHALFICTRHAMTVVEQQINLITVMGAYLPGELEGKGTMTR